MEVHAFLNRVLKHAPSSPPAKFELFHWAHAGRPTEEAFGILAIPGLDPQKAIDAVMDVDHYKGNIEHVASWRAAFRDLRPAGNQSPGWPPHEGQRRGLMVAPQVAQPRPPRRGL